MQQPDLEMRRGDLLPNLVLDVVDNGVPVDFSGADVVSVIGWMNGALLFKRVASGDANGVVTMLWQITDTDIPGTITCEVEGVWSAKPQSFRSRNKVKILPDLG